MHYQKDREIRQKEFICKPCHKQLTDVKYNNNVQNCGNSDLFGSNLNHEEGSQDNVHESRTHIENNMTFDFPSLNMTQTTTLTISVWVHAAIKLIYQDHNVSSSKKQSKLWQCCCARSIITHILNSYIQGIHLQEM